MLSIETRFYSVVFSASPIIIMLNGTIYLPGGIDMNNLPTLADEVVRAGIDAFVEISGGA
jgi:hypothetical protein